MFAGLSSCLWVISGALSGSYTLVETANPDTAGAGAARTCVVCGCLFAVCVFAAAAVNAAGGDAAGGGAEALTLALTPALIEGFVGLNLTLILWRRVYAELWPL